MNSIWQRLWARQMRKRTRTNTSPQKVRWRQHQPHPGPRSSSRSLPQRLHQRVTLALWLVYKTSSGRSPPWWTSTSTGNDMIYNLLLNIAENFYPWCYTVNTCSQIFFCFRYHVHQKNKQNTKIWYWFFFTLHSWLQEHCGLWRQEPGDCEAHKSAHAGTAHHGGDSKVCFLWMPSFIWCRYDMPLNGRLPQNLPPILVYMIVYVVLTVNNHGPFCLGKWRMDSLRWRRRLGTSLPASDVAHQDEDWVFGGSWCRDSHEEDARASPGPCEVSYYIVS